MAEPQPTSRPAHNCVLIVDDDPTILRLLAAWLEVSGYQVHQASDGAKALECIEEICPDYLITDWEMPLMDGPALCRRVREMQLPHYMYIVFLTSRKDRDDIIGGLHSGADDFLSKPIQKSELLARMLAGDRVLELERRLSYMAKSDVLTDLNTRRTFFDFLDKEWTRSARHNLPMSCVMFDIDFFKRINDQYGHPTGDLCLQTVARLLTQNCRHSDVVCRYAGDEFLALLPESEDEHAAAWAERLRMKIRDEPVRVGDVEIRMTATFGVAQREDRMASPQDLVDSADQTLLLAKQAGRDCVYRCDGLYSRVGVSNHLLTPKADLFGTATAGEIMTASNVQLQVDEPIERALRIFSHSVCPSVPVVDEQGRLCGLLSPHNLTEAIAFSDAWSRKVREFMSAHVVSFPTDEPAANLHEFLCRAGLSQAVVVDQDRPVGIVDLAGILLWLAGMTADGVAPATEDSGPEGLAEDLLDEVQQLHSQLAAACGETSDGLQDCVARISRLAGRLVALCPAGEPVLHAS